MAGTVMPAPKFVGLDNNANPVSAGKLYTYLAGTTTPQPTYTDVNLTVANANPVVLDSAGRATVFLSGTSYKFVLTDANDVPIWTQDNVQAVAPFSTNLDIEGIAGETILAGQVCYLSDGSGALTAGRWYLADADNAYSSSRPQIAIAPDAIGSGESGTFRLQGAATKSNAQPDFVVGSTYYVSATAGQLSLTPGTNQRVVGQADSTTTLVISPNPPNVAVTPTFTDGITVVSTDAGASAGPYLDLYRESASPAVSDQIGDVRFSGEDSAGNKQLYARMYGQIADPTSTTEDGQLRFATIRNGVETLALVLDENGNLLPDGASQTMGTATKPWLVYHIGSGGSLNFSNSDVTITHSTNTLTFAGAASGYIFNGGKVQVGAGFNFALEPDGTTARYVIVQATDTYAGALSVQAGGGSDGFGGGIRLYGHSHATYPGGVWIGRSTGSTGPIMFGTGGIGPGTEQMRLTSGGNLAIVATARLYLDGVAGTGDTYIYEESANLLSAVAGGVRGWRIDSNGNMDIAATKRFYLDGGSNTYIYEGSADNITMCAGGADRGGFNTNGVYVNTYPTTALAANLWSQNGSNIHISTSSIKYKHDIETLDAAHAQAAVMAMRPVTYRGKTDEDQRRVVGFIAEEMQQIAPLLCTYDEGGESGTPNYVTYDRVTAYLVAVVQQQQARIDALEARIH